jgi:protein TIF31
MNIKNGFFSHVLPELLSQASPLFKENFEKLNKSFKSVHPYELISSNQIYYPWCVQNLTPKADFGRSMDVLMKTTDSNVLYGSRDWNEDYQSIKELSNTTPSEKIIMDQALIRQHQDFVAFSTQSAVAIINQTIPTNNLSDCDSLKMFIYSNVFFSSGYDPRSHLVELGGPAAAHVACSKDIDGLTAVMNAIVPGVSTLDTVMIDYMGERMIAQTIIPGILKRQNNDVSPVKYGLVDDETKDDFASDESFHTVFGQLAKSLRLKEHSITAVNGENHSFHTSLECKGILGNDGRRYLLDAFRLTPVDIQFLDSVEADKAKNMNDAKYDYPHKVCLIRSEAIDLYLEYRYRLLEKEKEIEVYFKF